MSCQDCNTTVIPDILTSQVVVGPPGPAGPMGPRGYTGNPGAAGSDAVILLYSDTTDSVLQNNSTTEVLSLYTMPGNTLKAVGDFIEIEADLMGAATGSTTVVIIGFNVSGNGVSSLNFTPMVGKHGKIKVRIFYKNTGDKYGYDFEGFVNSNSNPLLISSSTDISLPIASPNFSNSQVIGINVFKGGVTTPGDFILRNVTIKKYIK